MRILLFALQKRVRGTRKTEQGRRAADSAGAAGILPALPFGWRVAGWRGRTAGGGLVGMRRGEREDEKQEMERATEKEAVDRTG